MPKDPQLSSYDRIQRNADDWRRIIDDTFHEALAERFQIDVTHDGFVVMHLPLLDSDLTICFGTGKWRTTNAIMDAYLDSYCYGYDTGKWVQREYNKTMPVIKWGKEVRVTK